MLWVICCLLCFSRQYEYLEYLLLCMTTNCSKLTYIYIHPYVRTYWSFNFDALSQGNAYEPTKEPINYRGASGDQNHYLQTEATPPAAGCPARSLHATEIVSKTQSQRHARGCTRKFGFFSAKGLKWLDSHAIVACAKLLSDDQEMNNGEMKNPWNSNEYLATWASDATWIMTFGYVIDIVLFHVKSMQMMEKRHSLIPCGVVTSDPDE